MESIISASESDSGLCFSCSGPGRYKCPKCHRPYCSLQCFRSETHDVCSQRFAEECILRDHIEDIPIRPDCSSDAENAGAGFDLDCSTLDRIEESDLNKQLAEFGIHADNMEELVAHLSTEERMEFERVFVNLHVTREEQETSSTCNDSPSSFWWNNAAQSIIDCNNLIDLPSEISNLNKSLHRIIDTVKLPPRLSPNLPNDIVNVLTAYVVAHLEICSGKRKSNAQQKSVHSDLSAFVSHASQCLSQNASFSTPEDACVQALTECEYLHEKRRVISDVIGLLQTIWPSHMQSESSDDAHGSMRCAVYALLHLQSAVGKKSVRAKLDFYVQWLVMSYNSDQVDWNAVCGRLRLELLNE